MDKINDATPVVKPYDPTRREVEHARRRARHVGLRMRKQRNGLYGLARLIPGRNGNHVWIEVATGANPSQIEWLCARYEDAAWEMREFALTELDRHQDISSDAIDVIVNRHIAAIISDIEASETSAPAPIH